MGSDGERSLGGGFLFTYMDGCFITLAAFNRGISWFTATIGNGIHRSSMFVYLGFSPVETGDGCV